MQHVRRQSERPWTAAYEVGLREALPALRELSPKMEELIRHLELSEEKSDPTTRPELAGRRRLPFVR
jgi:hypothetical protein